MIHSKLTKPIVAFCLLLILLTIPIIGIGCVGGEISGINAIELSSTLVPPIDLDVYIYVNQQVPTKVPASLTGAPTDISVQSLAIWGVVNSETQYTIAGSLTFTRASDASSVFSQIPQSTNIYTKLTNNTIYFLQGSGGPAQSIKNAIDTNNFKKYDDKNALTEVSKLPSGGTTKLGLIAIVKPNKTAVDMVKQYLDQNTANTVDSVFSNAKPRVLALGVFGSQPVDLADMAQRISNNTVWGLDMGVVVSMDSVYPGLIFGPIASRVIKSQGFPEVKVGDLTSYKDSVDLGNGQTIAIYVNVSGNHVYLTSSGKDSYAQTLLMSINR